MLCQSCQKRIANVHFTQIVNSNKVEIYLCEQCAREKGQFNFGLQLNISDFFNGIIGINNANDYISKEQSEACKKCGMSYEEFQKSGKLGCENCYDMYGEKLKPLIKRLHGSVEHSGKLPTKVAECKQMAKEIDKLKEQLNIAIKSEEYEKAAEIRDKIKCLEIGG